MNILTETRHTDNHNCNCSTEQWAQPRVLDESIMTQQNSHSSTSPHQITPTSDNSKLHLRSRTASATLLMEMRKLKTLASYRDWRPTPPNFRVTWQKQRLKWFGKRQYRSALSSGYLLSFHIVATIMDLIKPEIVTYNPPTRKPYPGTKH